MLGDNIRIQRLVKKFKQAHIAKEAGISQASYSRYERGKGDPRYSTLENIAKCIGCSIHDFFDPDQPPPPAK